MYQAAFFRDVVVTTGRNINLQWYLTRPDNIVIQDVRMTTADNWAQNDMFGINAGFFGNFRGYPHNTLTASFHIMDGLDVTPGGWFNRERDDDPVGTAMSSMVYYFGVVYMGGRSHVNPRIDPPFGDAPYIDEYGQFWRSQITWALGGFDLLLDQQFGGSDDFMAGWRMRYPTAALDREDRQVDNQRQRTAIGYNSSGDTIGLLVFSSGLSFYETHMIMSAMGFDMGLMLDGGGSTQVSFMQGGAPSHVIVDRGRNVPTGVFINNPNSILWQ